jgi:hypothetical protein
MTPTNVLVIAGWRGKISLRAPEVCAVGDTRYDTICRPSSTRCLLDRDGTTGSYHYTE